MGKSTRGGVALVEAAGAKLRLRLGGDVCGRGGGSRRFQCGGGGGGGGGGGRNSSLVTREAVSSTRVAVADDR